MRGSTTNASEGLCWPFNCQHLYMFNDNHSTWAKTLSHVGLFKGLTLTDLGRITSSMYPVSLPGRAPLLFIDEIGLNVYFLICGTVCIYRPNEGGGRFILNIVGAGETIGEINALDEQGHSANAVTTEKCHLLRMRRTDFQALVHEIPMLTCNLQRLMAARLRFASAHNEALAPYDVQRRVARVLLILSDRYRTDARKERIDPLTIPLRLTQLELAEMAGACRQRTSQTLKRLRRANCIEVNENCRITVTNYRELLRYCT